MTLKRPRLYLFVSALCLAAGLRPAAAAGAPALLTMVSVLPQAEFVRAVGGSRVAVEVMVPPGRSHENYEPSPRQLQALFHARLYFRIGLPFEESWMKRLRENNPGIRLVDTRQGVPMLAAPGGHAHGDEAPGSPDPHIWLDPNLVKIQAETIRAALAEADPAHATEYRENCRAFVARLAALDAELRRILRDAPARRFLVYHPSWGYFAKAYGLEQISIETEGKEPGPRTLARLIAEARRLGVRTIFVQKQFSPRSAKVIADAIGGRVAEAEDVPADYFAALTSLARAIAEPRP